MTSKRFSASPAVYTYRWAGVRRLGDAVVPVRISLGGPRFIPGAGRFPAIPELMPAGLFHVDDRDEFTRRFRERLDSFGIDVIQQRFDELHDRFPGQSLVLCCFEDLTKPGDWCHREVFSAFWRDRTGAEILDLQRVEFGMGAEE